MNRNQITLFLAIVAALLLARVALWQNDSENESRLPPPPEALQTLLLPESRALKDFALSDHLGKPFNLARLKGNWHLVFFGYTHCPDICPTTLGMLNGVSNKLKAQPKLAATTRFLFVSVDPKRDTPAHLKNYITYFDKDFIAATGQRDGIDALARQLGAVYMFEGDTESDNYIVNHSASVALIDPQGQWVARFNPPHTVSQFTSDYQQLRAYLDSPSTTETPQE